MLECPLCERGNYCEVHDDMPTVPNDKGERVDVTAPGDYDDGLYITVQTYLNKLEIHIPADMARASEFEVRSVAEALVALALKDYEETEAADAPEDK